MSSPIRAFAPGELLAESEHFDIKAYYYHEELCRQHGQHEERSDDPLVPVFFGFMRQLCKYRLPRLRILWS